MVTQEQTYMPAQMDADLIAALDNDPPAQGDQRFFLDVPGESRVELPPSLASMLRQAVQAMSAGLAVTVKPQTQQLTTSQVADLLGVTRPTVVKLLDAGAMPSTRVGTHRRVALPDALRYRDSRRQAQYQFIADTQTHDEPPPDETAAEMQAIRTKLARQRRQPARG